MDRRNITSVILCTTTMVHSLLIVAVQQHRYITTFTWFGLDRKLEGGWFSLNFKASEWLRKTAKCFSIWFEHDCSEGKNASSFLCPFITLHRPEKVVQISLHPLLIL